MRGIEGALFALQSVREGKFVGEVLRTLKDGAGEGITVPELSLASSLAYAALRREALWEKIFGFYIEKGRSGKQQKLSPVLSDCLLLGTAGLLELRHFAKGVLVNGLLEILKIKGQGRAVPMANAVLHNVARDGEAILEKFRRSPSLEDRALWAGLPVWTLPAWKKSWNNEELFELFELMQIPPCASLRTPPGKRDEVIDLLASKGMEGTPSDLFSDSIRLSSTVLPTLVPGFEEGLATVQTEGSMLVASLAADFGRRSGGLVLDMCSGRGVKGGQIAQSLDSARVECWELSSGRHLAAVREMKRLGVGERVALRVGNALSLVPSEKPSVVFLDAPCTGSGTWNRKPESKWKLSWAKSDKIRALQGSLLRRALTLIETGGIIIYVTCSLLRQENENIVAEALSDYPGSVVLDVPWKGRHVRAGRPWGTYVWPILPWLDGFYVSVIMKRAEG
ncbi:MAG: RsmB/NOP family class I SAM-dependent RNA methyltransferase [Synergistaceae bacterium]|nr:RsmB/NOP family class I SAM-dependent RNA methyltransferase [Synergistaceae bacterium]